MGNAILHAFNWTFKEIANQLPTIKGLGYNAVLTSPITFSGFSVEWWYRYQPIDYRIILSPLGDKNDFIDLLRQASVLGIDIYTDMVVNHMAHRFPNPVSQTEDLFYPGKSYLALYRKDPQFEANRLYGDINENLFVPDDFNFKRTITNYYNTYDVQEFRIADERAPHGLPDFDFQPDVLQKQRQLLLELKALGVKGFRVDAAKHMPYQHLNALFAGNEFADMFIFTEVISEKRDTYIDEILTQTQFSTYEFPLFYNLRRTFNWGGNMATLAQYESNRAIEPTRGVTFAVTHDIPNNSCFANLVFNDTTDELLANAYILCRDGGRPLIFADAGDDLYSAVSFDNRWKTAYQSAELMPYLTFNAHCHGSGMHIAYADEHVIVIERHNKGFAAFNKSTDQLVREITFNTLTNIELRSPSNNQNVTINNGKLVVVLEARSAQVYLG